MRQTKNNEPLGSARLEAAEPDRAACPTLGSVERSGFGFDDLLREQKHLDHPLAGVHGEYLKLIGRQRVQPLLERRRAFQCIFEAMSSAGSSCHSPCSLREAEILPALMARRTVLLFKPVAFAACCRL